MTQFNISKALKFSDFLLEKESSKEGDVILKKEGNSIRMYIKKDFFSDDIFLNNNKNFKLSAENDNLIIEAAGIDDTHSLFRDFSKTYYRGTLPDTQVSKLPYLENYLGHDLFYEPFDEDQEFREIKLGK